MTGFLLLEFALFERNKLMIKEPAFVLFLSLCVVSSLALNGGHLFPDLKIGCDSIHIVSPGDICDKIWKANALANLTDLFSLNSGLDCDSLFVNQVGFYVCLLSHHRV